MQDWAKNPGTSLIPVVHIPGPMAPGNARRCGNCSTAETTQVANAIEFSASLAAKTALAGLGRAGCGGRLVKQGGPENPKARRHTARLFLNILWCGRLCSARNRRKIFTETSCALMVSGATIHHSMLCQLRLHSSSRYFC